MGIGRYLPEVAHFAHVLLKIQKALTNTLQGRTKSPNIRKVKSSNWKLALALNGKIVSTKFEGAPIQLPESIAVYILIDRPMD